MTPIRLAGFLSTVVAEYAYRPALKESIMKVTVFMVVLSMVSIVAWGDFSCPDGTEAACLDTGDRVCPGSTRCVDNGATCFDEYPCDLNDSFVCASSYDDVMDDYKRAVSQYNDMASENTDMRERRLEQKNCVLNASTLDGAQRCVR